MNTGRPAERREGLDLPPLYRAIPLREFKDAFDHARSIAASEGAGTLVWVRRFDSVEFALVLEPEEDLATARRALYAAMNATGDALASYCPPEKPIEFSWPDTILLDGGIIGGARLAWPDDCAETAIPDWLVVGIVLRSVVALRAGQGHVFDQPGTMGTSLESEGFEMMDPAQLIGSFARHFMVYVDQWREKGFVPVGQHFLARLPDVKGAKRGIDTNGDLLVRTLKNPSVPERHPLVPALATPQWLDPETGEPWL